MHYIKSPPLSHFLPFLPSVAGAPAPLVSPPRRAAPLLPPNSSAARPTTSSAAGSTRRRSVQVQRLAEQSFAGQQASLSGGCALRQGEKLRPCARPGSPLRSASPSPTTPPRTTSSKREGAKRNQELESGSLAHSFPNPSVRPRPPALSGLFCSPLLPVRFGRI
ncbi:hypothetical protein DAI22_01g484000 [Oryza sativa Japonica Group]|nr:hypothetical protein DAI22_01g484000 [Oryza sativa Japonica Group]